MVYHVSLLFFSLTLKTVKLNICSNSRTSTFFVLMIHRPRVDFSALEDHATTTAFLMVVRIDVQESVMAIFVFQEVSNIIKPSPSNNQSMG